MFVISRNAMNTFTILQDIGGHLGFQNGRHFHNFLHILLNILTYKQRRKFKTVAIPMLVMSRNAINTFNLLYDIGGHLGFQNGRRFYNFPHILLNILTSKQCRKLKIVAIPMFLMSKNALNTFNLRYGISRHLGFQNCCHFYNFYIFCSIS